MALHSIISANVLQSPRQINKCWYLPRSKLCALCHGLGCNPKVTSHVSTRPRRLQSNVRDFHSGVCWLILKFVRKSLLLGLNPSVHSFDLKKKCHVRHWQQIPTRQIYTFKDGHDYQHAEWRLRDTFCHFNCQGRAVLRNKIAKYRKTPPSNPQQRVSRPRRLTSHFFFFFQTNSLSCIRTTMKTSKRSEEEEEKKMARAEVWPRRSPHSEMGGP